MKIPTEDEILESRKALSKLHPGNRLRLMAGMPLLPQNEYPRETPIAHPADGSNNDSILGDGPSVCLKCNGYGTLPMTPQMQRSGGCGWSVLICEDCGGRGMAIARRQSSSQGGNTNS